jgi:hypothetical protein
MTTAGRDRPFGDIKRQKPRIKNAEDMAPGRPLHIPDALTELLLLDFTSSV